MCIVKLIRKISKQVVDFNGTNRHCVADRNVYSTAECISERITGRRFRKRAHPHHRPANILKCIPINVRVRASQQEMNEWFEMRGTVLDLRAKEVREQVALNGRRPSDWEVETRGKHERTCIASVALQVHCDSEHPIDVEDYGSSTTVEAMPLREGMVWSEAHIGVVKS